MASENQVRANRRNSAKSTGPKTAQGKQVARMNALKHGLRAEHVVIPGENPEDFEALFRSLEDGYQPVGPVECILVERIAECIWRLQRLGRIETGIMRSEHFAFEKERAKVEMDRASYKFGFIDHAYNCKGEEDDIDDDSEEIDE